MKRFIILANLFLIYLVSIYGQEKILVPQEYFTSVESEYSSKISSSEVLRLLNEKNYLKLLNKGIANDKTDYILLSVYTNEELSFDQINSLESDRIQLFRGTWIPPLENYPYGFTLAKVPIEKINSLLSKNFVMEVGSAENQFESNNNLGTSSINANLVWIDGYTGTGVKVAILDSGLDTEPANSDLPATIEKRDYSNFPTSIDNNVENTVSGHGTHVTGSVLGRGTLSTANTGNGGGSYRGSAPNADIVFLKIGSDATSSATSAAIIASIQSAVDTFNADIISMSYGGWYDHHDGSSSEEQTVDWAYSQGVPVIMAAGNDGGRARHYSGTVNANSESGFIQLNVTGAGTNNTALYFNLVWADGVNRNNLSLKYYNSSFTELATTQFLTTESSRGTESKYSYYNLYVPSGNSIYYLKVVNPSNNNQFFHIYDVWGARVTFQSPDPFYTVGQPSTADYCLSVGAYTSRTSWTASDGGNYSFNGVGTLNDIAPFSSRGPRIDGTIKPNITAPGTAIISIRDRDVFLSTDPLWVDNDGIFGGTANYYVMQGTSMATPLTAGSVALILQRYPGVSPSPIYNAIQNYANVDGFTGSVPNNTWGYGKLDIDAAIDDSALPVELSLFTAKVLRSGGIILDWRTETEVSNYGFEVQRAQGDFEFRNSPEGMDGQNFEMVGFVEGHGNSNSPKDYSFTDENARYSKYSYRLKQIDTDGQFEYSKVIEVDAGNIPDGFVLEQNYPNPFNPSTTIKFAFAETQTAKLTIYDVLGNEIAIPFNGTAEGGKVYEVEFDIHSGGGWNLSSGLYFYQLATESKVENRKMLLIK